MSGPHDMPSGRDFGLARLLIDPGSVTDDYAALITAAELPLRCQAPEIARRGPGWVLLVCWPRVIADDGPPVLVARAHALPPDAALVVPQTVEEAVRGLADPRVIGQAQADRLANGIREPTPAEHVRLVVATDHMVTTFVAKIEPVRYQGQV